MNITELILSLTPNIICPNVALELTPKQSDSHVDDSVQSHDKCLLCDRFVNIVYIYILYMQIQLNLSNVILLLFYHLSCHCSSLAASGLLGRNLTRPQPSQSHSSYNYNLWVLNYHLKCFVRTSSGNCKYLDYEFFDKSLSVHCFQ